MDTRSKTKSKIREFLNGAQCYSTSFHVISKIKYLTRYISEIGRMSLLQQSLLSIANFILRAIFVSFFAFYSNKDYFILRGKFSLMYISVFFLLS